MKSIPFFAQLFYEGNVMTNRYKIKNGCFVVIDTENNNETILSNFTAKIVKKEKYVYDDGSSLIYYYIEGKTQKRETLKPINQLSEEDYKKGDWLLVQWGNKTELNSLNDQQHKKFAKHVLNAIVRLSRPIPVETMYEQTGVVVDSLGEAKFLFLNGAVTPEGIDLTSYCELPKQLNFFRLPEQMPDDEETKEAIEGVFSMLKFSEQNAYLGLLLCLVAIRATISMWLPIDQFVFLVNRNGNFKIDNAKIMQVIQSFFGATNKQNPLLSWKSKPKELKDFARNSNNGILCVNDFIYPEISNRRHGFAVKTEQFLRTVTNNSPESCAHGHVSIDEKANINCLVISAGEFPPRNFSESLHERGIYFPVKSGDIDRAALTELQAVAKDGTFAHANVAFIQYLLSDYEKYSALAEKWFDETIKANKQKFGLTDCAASNMAGLQVGWRFFRQFAVSKGVIIKTESTEYLSFVNQHLGSLMQQQKEVYSSNPGQLFIKGIRQALKDGKAHLIDSHSGLQPENILATKVGWGGNQPNGLWIGWHDNKTGEVFVCGDLKAEELICLLPEHDQTHFPKGIKIFWKDLKTQGLLKCPECDRNTTRKVLAKAYTSNNYHLNMTILRTPKSIKPTTKLEKQKPMSNGK
ncbi:MAG: hypothetical protein Q7U54_10415 [Bacteroidales bacterium]|nr:hypothetical protein [Bacteroidales bacterium]